MRYLILISWIALSLAKPAAETYLVNPEGTGDFPTIPAAIDAVVDGDVIDLTDGMFTGAGHATWMSLVRRTNVSVRHT
ncbi:MAG: hypothetical protein KAY24_17095 [Candidatus Eisenbacteria sp.]|nr:hypothetical protein [Candidatus Eisenbacteria bacterium]